jgi:hypothetical protein
MVNVGKRWSNGLIMVIVMMINFDSVFDQFKTDYCHPFDNFVNSNSKSINGLFLCLFTVIQGDPRDLTKSMHLLHRPGSIPGPIISGEKFTFYYKSAFYLHVVFQFVPEL